MNIKKRFIHCLQAAAALTLLMESPLRAADVIVDAQTTIDYLLSCQKENGAFGPRDQEYTDVAWNYPAVHALILLDEEIPRKNDALKNGNKILSEYGGHTSSNYWGMYQKAMLNKLLGGTGPFEWGRSWSLKYSPRGGSTKLTWSAGVYKDIESMWQHLAAVLATGGTVSNKNEIRDYVNRYQTGVGGYANGYDRKAVQDKDAHIIATHHAVMALTSLGLDVTDKSGVIKFLRDCQTGSGGFAWHPSNPTHGNKPDVWYTWAAINALKALGSEPADVPGVAKWINSLQNIDGGFGDRPGWASRLYSTYYAVHALEVLTEDVRSAITEKQLIRYPREVIPEDTYNIYVTHFKGPTGGTGETINKMLDWGFTSYAPREVHQGDGKPKGDNIPESLRHIEDNNLDVFLVHSPEKYHFKFEARGGSVTNHTSNWLRPAGESITPEIRAIFDKSNQLGGEGFHWDEFKDQVLEPVFEIGTLYWPELDWSMMDAYSNYDDALDGNVGWNAVVAGLGWPPWDWLRTNPFRERWIGQLPMIIDGDAHGDADSWKKALTRQRTLYLAKDNTYEGFMDAVKENRIVSIIFDHEGCCDRVNPDGGVPTFYGPPAVKRYVMEHQNEWRWEELPEFPVNSKQPVNPNSWESPGIQAEGTGIHVLNNGEHSVEVYDVSGRNIYRFRGQNQTFYPLNPGKGLYFIRARIGGKSFNLKMILF